MANIYKCKMCNGGGKIDSGWWAPIIETCPICKGEGVIDWITNITWKKTQEEYVEKKGLKGW